LSHYTANRRSPNRFVTDIVDAAVYGEKLVEAAGFDQVILYFNVGLKPHNQVSDGRDGTLHGAGGASFSDRNRRATIAVFERPLGCAVIFVTAVSLYARLGQAAAAPALAVPVYNWSG
jgi:hypothetical protein